MRWELSIEGRGPDRVLVSAGDGLAPRWAHLCTLGDGVRAVGVRRRTYQPLVGFHPGLPASDPLTIEWAWAGRSQRIDLWAWRPGGGPYPGLPLDEVDAVARRQERIAITTRDLAGALTAPSHWPQPRPFTIDLRTE
jgi:uncharacterized protein (DUF2126 family)